MVAKVIPPKGEIFFVPEETEIHQLPEYDGLPREDKKQLAYLHIIGTADGFIVKPCGEQAYTVDEGGPPLILPMGTRIEAVPEHPSLREK